MNMLNKKMLHALAILAVIGGVIRAVALISDPQLKSLVLTQYILWAILFEIAALNVKE